jgi:RimJ/RimL family protein N-acetyltransferase
VTSALNAEHEFAIRPLRRDDIEPLLDFLDQIVAERRWLATEPPLPRERWRKGFEQDLDDPYCINVLAVDADERLIGQIDARGRAKRPAEIGMAVAEEWRGRGVGSALMRACIDSARERGIHKLALNVWPHNEAAIRLYEKFGFVREGVLRSHYERQNGERWDAIVMGLLLD